MKSLKYFSATWCGPCKVFKPVMQEIASQGSNVEFIDVDEQSDVAAEFGVRSVPTSQAATHSHHHRIRRPSAIIIDAWGMVSQHPRLSVRMFPDTNIHNIITIL